MDHGLTGKVIVANSYNANSAVLESVSKFGKPQQSMTYYADGTLATKSDGLGHATSFSNYKRGIAQNVVFADSTSESAVVNNIGNIDSVTDPNNYTTNFTYDAIGRLNRIFYPTLDTVGWNDTTLTFEPVPVGEYGLGVCAAEQIE